jgi:hypothetical protein
LKKFHGKKAYLLEEWEVDNFKFVVFKVKTNIFSGKYLYVHVGAESEA